MASAFELFAERGYGGTTTKDIAQVAQVNEVTVFRLFGSKEALFKQVVEEKLPLERIQAVVHFDMEGNVEEMMVKNALMVLEILKENRHFFMMLVGEVWRHPQFKGDTGPDMIDRAIQFLAGHIGGLMDKGMLRSMDPVVAAKAWMGMVQSYYLTNYLLGQGNVGQVEEERLLRGMADIFVNGLGMREGC